MVVWKVHGETERCRKWVLEGNHDNPVSGTHPNQSTGAWRKKGDRERGSHRTWFPQGHLGETSNLLTINTKEKQLETKKWRP